MKKTSKKPRKFGRRKVKANPMKKLERQIRRMSSEAIELMNELQPGFAAWYHESYDESGKFIEQRIPGLFE
jgi:hypothetical protein